MNLLALKEQREAAGEAFGRYHKDTNELAEKEGRDWTQEEDDKFDQLKVEFESLAKKVRRAEAVEINQTRSREADDRREEADRHLFEHAKAQRNGEEQDPNRPLTQAEKHLAFQAWGMGGRGLTDAQHDALQRCGISGNNTELEIRLDRGCDASGLPFEAPRSHQELREQAMVRREVRSRDGSEYRAQSVGTGSEGGFTAPDSMMQAIDKQLLAFGGMRQAARIISTDTGTDMPIPTVNDTANKGSLVAENAAISNTDVVFGQVVLNAYKYTSDYVPVSWELMQDSATNMASFLGDALGERLGRIINEHMTTGTGSGQPNGVVTAAGNSSVTTSGATAITWGNLMSLKHSVDPAYRSGAIWMFNDATLAIIKQIADSQSRPLWHMNLPSSEPGTLDGNAYVVNQDMADGASAKSVLFGDFSKYIIRDVRSITLRRLDELHALNGQTTFLAHGRWDGDLLQSTAIKYMTQGA